MIRDQAHLLPQARYDYKQDLPASLASLRVPPGANLLRSGEQPPTPTIAGLRPPHVGRNKGVAGNYGWHRRVATRRLTQLFPVLCLGQHLSQCLIEAMEEFVLTPLYVPCHLCLAGKLDSSVQSSPIRSSHVHLVTTGFRQINQVDPQ
jgi:hypothetical protein